MKGGPLRLVEKEDSQILPKRSCTSIKNIEKEARLIKRKEKRRHGNLNLLKRKTRISLSFDDQ